jgi:hypothetical protein
MRHHIDQLDESFVKDFDLRPDEFTLHGATLTLNELGLTQLREDKGVQLNAPTGKKPFNCVSPKMNSVFTPEAQSLWRQKQVSP